MRDDVIEALEEIKARAGAAIPGARIEIIPNPGLANQPPSCSITRINRSRQPARRPNAASIMPNVTGVDCLDRTVKKKVKLVVMVAAREDIGDGGGIFSRLSRGGLPPLLDDA
jgi:hypothetical protein